MRKMKLAVIIFIGCVVLAALSCSKTRNDSDINSKIKNTGEGNKKLERNIYDISVKNMDGETIKLSDYKGKVLLIVNVASKCGYTPQYKGLENVYQKYRDKGFEILAFPCNDFGEQEPGTNDEIRTFCENKYNVSFPLFDKVHVLGDDKSELYDRLINNSEPMGDIGWNFEKFLIDKNGDIAGRFKSKIKPESDEIVGRIEAELN